MKKNVIKDFFEKSFEIILLISALISVVSATIITIYIFYKGIPPIFKIGIIEFIFGLKWKPSEQLFGIFPMIISSIYATLGAILIGVPIGILTAVFLSEYAPKQILVILKPAIELLSAIPSVVYGFFGLVVLIPIIDKIWGGGGNSLFAAIIILAVMILPTIINISESSIKAVPKTYKEGSLALGASKIQTIFTVMLPAAKSGILASVVLGIGRAIGETMAVILVCGNTPLIPNTLFSRVRTMTANIALEMSYAFGLHQDALFATGVILFIFIMVLNLILNFVLYGAGESK